MFTVDHNAGNIVIMTPCTGATYQSWNPDSFFVGSTLVTQYVSAWDPSLCLTYNASGANLKVGGCGNDWYQEFVGD